MTPPTATLVPHQTVQLTATPRDAAGNPLAGRTVTWSASPANVASVGTTGLVTALAPGTATVTATSEGQAGTAALTVREGGMVGPTGASVVALQGAVTLAVPAGALPAPTPLTVAPEPAPPAHPALVPGTAYALGPDGTQFAQPVTVRIRYEANQLPPGANQAQFGVHRWTGTAWEPLAARAVDLANRRVSGETTRFSTFAIIELPSNPVPTLTALAPTSAVAGNPAFDLTVTGTGFVPASVVQWNGANRTTTYLSVTQLRAQITAADIAHQGVAQVRVFNPAPGGGQSAVRTFTINPPPPSLAVSINHACAIGSNRVATCWGVGSFGALGHGKEVAPPVYQPVPVLGGHTFTALSAGGAVTCGLKAAGSAWCWGSGGHGQLGHGSFEDRSQPAPVAGGHAFKAISTGGTHTCAVRTDGTAWCWGRNHSGQLGTGSTASSNAPVPVSGGLTFSTISAGTLHTCGVTTSGTAWCWGTNTLGQLGNGGTVNATVPVPVAGGLTFQAVSAGSSHTCGLATNGTAYCWGSNHNYQIGDGGENSGLRVHPSPVAGGHLYTIISTASTFHFSCGLTTAGQAFCWGANVSGLESGDVKGPRRVTAAPVLQTLASGSGGSINVGVGHTCGVTPQGVAWCWGSSGTPLGLGTAQATGPGPVVGGLMFATAGGAIAAGGNHSCGLTTTGAAWCWGEGTDGQRGDGKTSNQYVPAVVSGGHAFAVIAASDEHTCAVTTVGTAWCWGQGDNGKLGTGSNAAQTTPAPVAGGHTFTSISAGGSHSCGITAAGTAWCWGANGSGQLGNGSTTSSNTPVAVSGNHPFRSISAGASHTCAVTTAGVGLCWGSGLSGRLGNGATSNRTTPTPVSGDHTWTHLSAGFDYTCGVATDGSGRCWGAGSSGKLGTGSTASSNVPVAVAGGHQFRTIAAGRFHTCALRADETAWCWGDNELNGTGKLGTGTTASSTTPVAVAGGHRFAAIAVSSGNTLEVSSYGFTCGITTTGPVYCWGSGFRGRLGNGQTADRLAPTAVAPAAP